MARTAFQCTLGQALPDGRFNTSYTMRDSVSALASTANGSLMTSVDNAVTTLVADGASPTQAHVTTLNNAWGPLKTALAAAATAGTGDAILDIDNTIITNQNGVRAAVRKLLEAVAGSGLTTG